MFDLEQQSWSDCLDVFNMPTCCFVVLESFVFRILHANQFSWLFVFICKRPKSSKADTDEYSTAHCGFSFSYQQNITSQLERCMFTTSQPDGCKNLICCKKLIAAENLKDLLEGLSCNKSRQGTKKTDPALSNCCLSISFPTAVPRLYLMQCSTTGYAAWDSWCWGPRHISTGAYSSYTCQLGSFEGNLLWALRDGSAIQTKAQAVETVRGFASKARSHPNRSTTVDIAAYT